MRRNKNKTRKKLNKIYTPEYRERERFAATNAEEICKESPLKRCTFDSGRTEEQAYSAVIRNKQFDRSSAPNWRQHYNDGPSKQRSAAKFSHESYTLSLSAKKEQVRSQQVDEPVSAVQVKETIEKQTVETPVECKPEEKVEMRSQQVDETVSAVQGVKSTYDEGMEEYTTKLDKVDTPGWEERERFAAMKAEEICKENPYERGTFDSGRTEKQSYRVVVQNKQYDRSSASNERQPFNDRPPEQRSAPKLSHESYASSLSAKKEQVVNMAASLRCKVEEHLTCSVCLEPFKDPKVFPCLHSYCHECIVNLTKNTKSKTIDCPECRLIVQEAE